VKKKDLARGPSAMSFVNLERNVLGCLCQKFLDNVEE
jgi:hypothetical protein